MKHIIRKPYWNWEKEEKWLNDLSAQGLALTDYSWCRYVFEETEPGAYVYRIDMLDHLPSHPQSRKYITFLEETGVEHVTSYMRWVYFRKKADGKPFLLYSDIPSQIAHNKRVRALWLPLAVAELCIGLSNILTGIQAPFSALRFVLGVALCLIGIALGFYSLQIHRKIRTLQNEARISDG